MPDENDVTHGSGTVSYDNTVGRWRLRMRTGGMDESKWFDREEDAQAARQAYIAKLNVAGVTLGELCEARLDAVSFTQSASDTVQSLILSDDISKRAAHTIWS